MCVHILLTIVNFLGGSAKCQGGKCIYVHSHKGLLMYACGTIFFQCLHIPSIKHTALCENINE